MTAEKRRFSRVIFNVRAQLTVDQAVYTVERIGNLSIGGCQLQLNDRLLPGTACKFTVFLPRMGPGIEVFGEVVRSAEGEAGIKFTRIDPDNLSHLQNIIRYNAEDPDLIEEEIQSHPGLK